MDVLKTNETLNKVSIIGVGNAGCQVIDKAVEHDYQVFAINSSLKDLDDSIVNKNIPSYIIGNKKGAGKNRNIAKEFIKKDLNLLFNEAIFENMIETSDIVVVVCSTAGGTGSGVSPLLVNRLQTKYPLKTIIFFGFLPKRSESAQSQFNAVECVKEISNKDYPMTYMLGDLSTFETLPINEAYDKMVEYAINSINTIRGDRMHQSPYGMIDENDLLSIINEPGYMAVVGKDGITQKDLETKTSQEHLIEVIKNGESAQIQRDGVVHKIGVMIHAPEQMSDEDTRAGNFAKLESYVGYPLNTFLNYSMAKSNKADINIILSGLTCPLDRMEDCVTIAKRSEAALADRYSTIENEDIAFIKNAQSSGMNKLLGKVEKKDKEKDLSKDIPDIF